MKIEYLTIFAKFKSLIYDFGNESTLDVFFNGIECELNGSTIDCIKDNGDNIIFYYNGNTNDFDTIEAFEVADLEEFYENVKKWFIQSNSVENNRDVIEEYIDDKMSSIITDAYDRNEFVSNIISAVICDLIETADRVNWNDSDIDIALARVLVKTIY